MQRGVSWSARGTSVREARLGSGRVLNGERLEQLLDAAGVHRDPLAEQKELRVMRRHGPEGPEYFIVATDPIRKFVQLGGDPAAVALLDPMTGRTGLATMSGPNEEFRGPTHDKAALLILEKGQSIILRELRRRPTDVAAFPYLERFGRPVALSGPWSVTFVDGGPVLPKPFTSDNPIAWTGRGDDDADRFAGTARYSVTFDALDTVPRHLLSLGRVAESARVRLNGRELGVVFAHPFTIETGPLRRTGNVLEIEVTNVSANRIRDLDRRGVEWKIFRDINFVGIDYKPFDASKWPVRASGLIGPVTIQPIAREMINAVQ